MSWRDCVGLALGRPLREGEDKALQDRFAAARQRQAIEGKPTDDMAVAQRIATEIGVEEALAKRNVLLNKKAYAAAKEYLDRFGNKALGIRAMLAGINEVLPGGRDSIDARIKGIFQEEFLGAMLADFRRSGAEMNADLLRWAQLSENELAIRQAMRGEKVENPLAMKAGEILNKYLDRARLAENAAGSWIGRLDDYGGGQSHDARKVFRAAGHTPRNAAETEAAFQAWRTFAEPLLDWPRMAIGLDGLTRDDFLRQTWNAIAADRWDTASGGSFTGLHHFIGPMNLAKRHSEAHRVLHFKDAAAAQAYNDRFGSGALMESVLSRLERSARATALMERLGPNPEAMLQRLRDEYAKAAQGTGDVIGARELSQKKIDHIDNLFAEVTGATRQAANKDMAYWASGLRALESMSKLGAATLSSFGDIATVAGELRYQGRGFLSSYAEALGGLFRGRGAGETRIIADLVGVGFQGLIGGVHARFHSTDGAVGRASRLLNQFFRWNLLNWWTDTHQSTSGLVTARYFALNRQHAWANLPEEAQRLLTQYGIGRDGWNVLRKGATRKGDDGTEFLVAEAVRALPDEAFGLAGREAADARTNLARQYAALITDRADFAVPTPGARERAMMNFGTERGTVLGEALRFVMQFKAFPLAMISKVAGREVAAAGGYNMSAMRRMGEMILQLTAMGYLSMAAKDAIRGKEPPDPLNVNTMYRAMTQGGGLGIYGDFILGEHDRFGRSPAETALGPVAGTAGDIVKLLNKAIRGETSAADGLRFAVQNTPFLNLFYVRPALDYFVLHPIYESLKPGYTSRLKREAEKRYGQDYWWY